MSDIFVEQAGNLLYIYDESLDASCLGEVTIRRASVVDPRHQGWFADLSPSGGPILGPFAKRSQAIDAELSWLRGQLAHAALL